MLMGFGSPGRSPGTAMDMDAETTDMSYEEEVASIMGQLLQERITAKDAVAALEMMCHRRAHALRFVRDGAELLIWQAESIKSS